jgi:hypothetical protein
MVIRRLKLAPLLAAAVAGLVVGLAVPSAATEAGHLINGASISNHTISGKKLLHNTVTGKQIKESTLGAVPAAVTAKRLPALTWHALTLQQGWVGVGSPEYAVDAQGIVHLQGGIEVLNPPGPVVAFTLPAAARPRVDIDLTADENGGYTGRLHIKASGDVGPEDDPDHPGSAALFTVLSGISYPTS